MILTAIDKFSKYAIAKPIKSRASEDIRQPLREILYALVPETIVMDNERSFKSESINFMMKNEFGIEVFRTAPYASSSNGQVERFHSTLQEIMRCIQQEKVHRSFQELLDRSVKEYNFSIHSTTNGKPIELFFGRRIHSNPELRKHERENIERKIKYKQEKNLAYHNKKRTQIINYKEGDEILVKINKRIGNKLTEKYKKEIVNTNKNTTVKTKSGKLVHKSNIKQN